MTPSSDIPAAGPASRGEESNIESPKSKIHRLLAYRTLLGLALAVFVLDQLTKFWIVQNVPFDPRHSHGLGSDIPAIDGFFYLIHVGNTGAAWSMFSGQSVLLAILAAGTLLAIFFWRHSLGLRARFTQICFGLLCGGVAGNLVDRLLHGHVVDFIDLHFGSYVYPTFNVADSGICVGVVLYLIHSLRGDPRPETNDQGPETKG